MFTIKENVKNEIIINKSRFITCLFKLKDEKDVKTLIEKIKKEYKDATHYCYAYVFDNTKRFNDDGEPSHTAGMPMLNVLENKKLNHVLAIVIRYFGGIKLGANGLIRAYTNSVAQAIKDDNITPIIKKYKVKIEFDYKDINNVNYILKDYKVTYKEYDENVIYEFEYENNNYPVNLDKYIITKKGL